MMNATKLTRIAAALGAAAALSQTLLLAQTLDPWQTVDDFQLVPGLTAHGSAIATDTSGVRLFSVGSGSLDTAGNQAAVVNLSEDSGQNWTKIADLVPPGMISAGFTSFTVDPITQGLFAGGVARDAANPYSYWFVCRSDDGGANWITEELFKNTPALNSACGGLKADATGNLYAGGEAPDAAYAGCWMVRRRDAATETWSPVDALGSGILRAVGVHPSAGIFAVGLLPISGVDKWVVRRSANGFAPWTTVDSFAPTRDGACATAITVDGSGAVYVVGFTLASVNRNMNWIARRSTNGGKTWTTIDTFSYSSRQHSVAQGVACDHLGNLYVAGCSQPAYGSPAQYHWLVRKGTLNPVNGRISWRTSDDFEPVSGQTAAATGITVDAAGNLFATGRASDSSGTGHWLVRKLAAP